MTRYRYPTPGYAYVASRATVRNPDCDILIEEECDTARFLRRVRLDGCTMNLYRATIDGVRRYVWQLPQNAHEIVR